MYDNVYAPSIYHSHWEHLAYLTSKSQFRCPTAKPEDIWPNGDNWAIYGTPHNGTLSSSTYTVTSDSTVHLFTRGMKDPSRFIGLADSLKGSLMQAQQVGPWTDAQLISLPMWGRYHLRHNNLANAWYYDGHAEKIGIDGVAEFVRTCGPGPIAWPNGKDLYATTEKYTTVTTNLKY